jgi:hypothetical protein
MKYLALIPLVFVASCASHPPLAVRPAPPAAVAPADSLRYAEVVRAYYVGRHVEPNHPEMMEDEHPVYRVEVSSRWNLHPGLPNAGNLLNPPPDAAFAPPPTNDVVIAEMNRQRETTALVMQQAVRLAQSYQELQKIFGEMKTVAHNNATLNARLTVTEKRVTDMEKDLQKDTISPSATNDVSNYLPESTDSQKP